MKNFNGTNSNETMAELYDRRDGETPQAYEAARAYFELGSARSLVAAAQKCNKGVSILGRWSAKWDWAARARAWDDVRQRELDAAVAKAIFAVAEKVAAEWETRDQQIRQQKYDFTQRTIAKLDKMLEFPLATVTTETVDRAGGPARVTTVRPSKWTFDTIGRVAKIMFALAEQAARNTGGTTGDELERDENWMIENYAVPSLTSSLTSGDAAKEEPVPNQPVNAITPPDK
jgi:hypothetical protein